MSKQSCINNKEDTKKLLDLLRIKYGFNGFYHYTDYSNLCSIYEAGALVCRSKIGAEFHDSADQEVLSKAPGWIHDHVRLFYFSKTPFLYKIEGIKPSPPGHFGEVVGPGPHMPRPVAFLFNEEIAYTEGIKFLDGSASNLLAENTEHIPQITKYAKDAIKYNWCLINYRGPIPTRYGSEFEVCGETDGKKMTDHKNAEILIPDKLPLAFLKGIVFRSEADRKQAILEFGDNKLFSVDFGTFNNNNSYLFDYKVDWQKRHRNIHIDLEIFPGLGRGSRINRHKHIMKLYSYDNVRREELFDFQNRYESVDLHNCEEITKVEYYMDNTLCAIWEASK